MPPSPIRRLAFLLRAALACALLLGPACAPMVETRTDTIVAREPGRRVGAWHPDRDQLDVSVRVEGEAIVASVARSRACTWAIGERRKVTTKIDRSADTTVVVMEGIAAGWLMAIGAAAGDSDVPAAGYIPFALGAGLGAGFLLDLSAGGVQTTQRTEVVQTGVQESQACEAGAGSGAIVSFALADGQPLSCTTGPDGSCRVNVPPGAWEAAGGTLVVNVSVDGRLLRHEELKKPPPLPQ